MSIDIESSGVVSNCCGATVIYSDICSECREHCDPVDEDGNALYSELELHEIEQDRKFDENRDENRIKHEN